MPQGFPVPTPDPVVPAPDDGGGSTPTGTSIPVQPEPPDNPSAHDLWLDSDEIATGDNATSGVATVYVHDGTSYTLTGGRIFIGPEDPAADGFTVVDGDQWEDTTA